MKFGICWSIISLYIFCPLNILLLLSSEIPTWLVDIRLFCFVLLFFILIFTALLSAKLVMMISSRDSYLAKQNILPFKYLQDYNHSCLTDPTLTNLAGLSSISQCLLVWGRLSPVCGLMLISAILPCGDQFIKTFLHTLLSNSPLDKYDFSISSRFLFCYYRNNGYLYLFTF